MKARQEVGCVHPSLLSWFGPAGGGQGTVLFRRATFSEGQRAASLRYKEAQHL